MDHHQFDEEVLKKGTAAILKTRDGKLRAAVPNPIGSCVFLNDVDADEMNAALHRHKALMKEYPRNGEGIEAYVDASDTGYEEQKTGHETKDDEHVLNGATTNGAHHDAKAMNGIKGTKEKVGHGVVNGVNGHTNGVHA